MEKLAEMFLNIFIGIRFSINGQSIKLSQKKIGLKHFIWSLFLFLFFSWEIMDIKKEFEV